MENQMKFGIFATPFPKDHALALEAIRQGLEKLGRAHFITGMEYQECDIAIVFGVWKKAVRASWARGAIIDTHKGLGKNVIIVEKGFVKRDEYFHMGWNGLNGRADFCNAVMPAARWEKLNVRLASFRKLSANRPIILCGQVPWDASVQHSDHNDWLQNTVALLRTHTERKIIFREHPALAGKFEIKLPGTERSEDTFENDLGRAHAVVTYNSNSAVEAVIAGVPAFVADRGTMAAEVANWELSDIETPLILPRQQWAYNLGYAQWTLDEMREGFPIHHLTGKELNHEYGERRVP